ncbi:carotenoid biosynthesis protein [Subsaximicrobium wynnwilliamsii]|uniref:Carotenoid biosynthesis protein n=1 Tax=Subsaximicrobium wynnwilliamsii TaxID=291179 RepID=A0A5C6ZJH4_9FLAO|nr:carotenoid biosynthesis protein [Subsaximicrobium wynnwilliamsii]TXD81584.1 carotenoid biosynthesis protein [Subsaximicrobium wynnwilliamsii]TXD89946.1 carotenoid biosynthesis protein [Subsaximicrobium wynnwilliamsii]TXE01045.1 carotenoid biosynthesis protein [Subsaximicrobium wynnwilliamsii]
MDIKKIILVTLSILFFIIGFMMSSVPSKQFVETGSIIAVGIISMPAFYGMWKIYGRRGIAAIMALGVFALIIESIGIHTGFPYSPFEYTMPFGYKLLGTTPWTVFIAWSPLVFGAWLLAQTWFEHHWARYLAYLGILVGTDMILDPGAVARGLWEYTNGGLWFDVPLQNFIGWMISGTIAYLILKLVLKPVIVKGSVALSKHLWIGTLSLLVSIFLWTGVDAGYGLWAPMIVGIIIGTIIIKALFKTYATTSKNT